MKITKATYLISSPSFDLCPKLHAPEYAFIGRSNVGKSSIINAIVQQKNLAKTKATKLKIIKDVVAKTKIRNTEKSLKAVIKAASRK
jgi:GTP-binding protein